MERDWFDWASLIFNTLATSAGLVGLFIAVRAYKVAKEQGRKTFELEILRELATLVDDAVDKHTDPSSDGSLPKINAREYSRLLLLPEGEFPVWFALARHRVGQETDEFISNHPAIVAEMKRVKINPERKLAYAALSVMYREVHGAMKKRSF